MRFFFSDPHFGDYQLTRSMGRCYPMSNVLFKSAEDFDDHLIAQINAQVMRDDELFCLGDWSKDKPGKYRARINCKHVRCILGNHDKRQKCENVFGPCQYMLETKLRGEKRSLRCVLSHFPIAFWDGSHNGTAHLYGHCHGQREGTLDAAFPGRRSLDVTVDNLHRLFGSYAPLSEEFLYTRFTARQGHDDIAHYDAIKAERDRRLGTSI